MTTESATSPMIRLERANEVAVIKFTDELARSSEGLIERAHVPELLYRSADMYVLYVVSMHVARAKSSIQMQV